MYSVDRRTTDEQPPDSAYVDICGFSVPEEDTAVVESMAQFVETVHQFGDHEIVDYEYQRDHARHVFRAADGKTIYPRWSWLQQREPIESIVGTKQITHDSRLFEVDINKSDLKYSIGDVIEDDLSAVSGVVVGHRYNWRTNEYIFSGGVCGIDVEVQYLVMDYNAHETNYRYQFFTDTQTVASFPV